MFPIVFRWTQPERDVRWLHGLLHDCYQLPVQVIQVHLIAQCRAERCQRAHGVILAAIEAPVNEPLNATAQGLE